MDGPEDAGQGHGEKAGGGRPRLRGDEVLHNVASRRPAAHPPFRKVALVHREPAALEDGRCLQGRPHQKDRQRGRQLLSDGKDGADDAQVVGQEGRHCQQEKDLRVERRNQGHGPWHKKMSVKNIERLPC